MVLHRQILFGLATVSIAEAILMQTSAAWVSSSYRDAPRYFKLVTCSNFWPFMLISALVTGGARAVGHDLGLFFTDFHSI